MHHQTPGPTGMLSESQLGSDLRSTGQRIPDDVQRSLRERNVKVASLSGMRMVDHRLQIAELDPVFTAARFDRDRKFEELHPDAFADAHAWLPGFSDDGKEAVVRFWFGPTPHGATATYFLVKRSSGWQIKWHRISHYL